MVAHPVTTIDYSANDYMPHPDPIHIRDAVPTDFAQILTLNEASVQVLSPLSPKRLAQLHRQAAYHRVLVDRDRVAAFLLAFREATQYDSLNYRWFNDRYPTFLYIDRIVVAQTGQGRGIGRRLYADLFAFAAHTHAGLVTCEFDIDPPTNRRAVSTNASVSARWARNGSARTASRFPCRRFRSHQQPESSNERKSPPS